MTTPRAVARREQRQALVEQKATKEATREEWLTMPLPEAKQRLANMRAEMEMGAQIIQQRISSEQPEMVCEVCKNPIRSGYPARIDSTLNLHGSGIPGNMYYCSAECVSRKNQQQSGVLTLANG